MRKIAIIKGHHNYENYNDEYIIDKITDFVEVTDEEYNVLQQCSYEEDFRILEIPTDIKTFVADTVAKYLERAREVEAKRKKAEEKRKAQAAENKKKQEAKKAEQERKQLEKLLAKHGLPQTAN